MQEGKSGKNHRHQRKQRLSYSCSSSCSVNSLFQTIRSRLRHLVHFLCAVQVKLTVRKV